MHVSSLLEVRHTFWDTNYSLKCWNALFVFVEFVFILSCDHSECTQRLYAIAEGVLCFRYFKKKNGTNNIQRLACMSSVFPKEWVVWQIWNTNSGTVISAWFLCKFLWWFSERTDISSQFPLLGANSSLSDKIARHLFLTKLHRHWTRCGVFTNCCCLRNVNIF
jgi:hypothetical protein